MQRRFFTSKVVSKPDQLTQKSREICEKFGVKAITGEIRTAKQTGQKKVIFGKPVTAKELARGYEIMNEAEENACNVF